MHRRAVSVPKELPADTARCSLRGEGGKGAGEDDVDDEGSVALDDGAS